MSFSRSVVSDSLWESDKARHGLQHTNLPCLSLSPRTCSNSHPSSQWCHPAISSSVVPFSSALNLSQHQGLFQWVSSSHQYWSFSFSISPSNDHPGLISFRMDWLDLFARDSQESSSTPQVKSNSLLEGWKGAVWCILGHLATTLVSTWVGKVPWRRPWQPTPLFLPGEPHGQRSLLGYRPRGRTEWTRLKPLSTHAHCIFSNSHIQSHCSKRNRISRRTLPHATQNRNHFLCAKPSGKHITSIKPLLSDLSFVKQELASSPRCNWGNRVTEKGHNPSSLTQLGVPALLLWTWVHPKLQNLSCSSPFQHIGVHY